MSCHGLCPSFAKRINPKSIIRLANNLLLAATNVYSPNSALRVVIAVTRVLTTVKTGMLVKIGETGLSCSLQGTNYERGRALKN